MNCDFLRLIQHICYITIISDLFTSPFHRRKTFDKNLDAMIFSNARMDCSGNVYFCRISIAGKM